MSPIRIYTNWNKRESSDREQIEPYRKYFFICEGEKTEYWYFKSLIDNRKNIGTHPLIDLRFMEKTEEDIGLSNPKALIKFAENQKKLEENAFDEDHDKMIIVFDADIYKGNSELFHEILIDQGKDNILAVTNPSFELFLLLHYTDAFESIINPNEKLIYENRKKGKRRYIDKLFSETSNMNSKSNSKIGELVHSIDTAIEQEKKINQDITLSTEMITSNIGNVIAGILDEKPI